ncbi:hypothetical protein [Nonomuraea cavernae]|uniref:hypothetical protein n=1 Tax=Nonomuraea cavernae TaxID=2045107 RepID=UPI00340C9AD3
MERWAVDSPFLIVRGRNYVSIAAAEAAARQWRAALMLSFAKLNIGADFGTRAPQGQLADSGRRILQEHIPGQLRQVLDDVHGILVFPSEPTPLFVTAMPVRAVLSRPVQDVVTQALALVNRSDPVLDDAQLVAHSLFASSFSEASVDARFLMLMMAVETLIEPDDRSDAEVALVDHLIDQAKRADIPVRERDSLIGSLRSLRKQSIGQAGQSLASRLGDQQFSGESPAEFFKNCYALRSHLVHGKVPRPSREAVGLRAATLQIMVGRLLSHRNIVVAGDLEGGQVDGPGI